MQPTVVATKQLAIISLMLFVTWLASCVGAADRGRGIIGMSANLMNANLVIYPRLHVRQSTLAGEALSCHNSFTLGLLRYF